MGRQHALDVGQAPRWILLIRLNLIGTITSNAVQGTQIPNFRNPYLVYDGSHAKRTPDGEVVVDAAFNRREVLEQDLRRDRLLPEIDRICSIYDIRNVSEPDDERFYEAVQQIIFKNDDFFEPGIARILHAEDHPLHIRTLVAVYGLMALAAEQERNAKGLYEAFPIMPAPPDHDIHVFNILVFDPVRDFPSVGDKAALAINPWAQLRNPRRADPTDLASLFTHPKTLSEPVVIRIAGRPTLRKIFTAFWVELGGRRGGIAGPKLLPSNIIGYMDWDPAVKPKDHEDLWPQRLVTGGYQPIGAERHLNAFLESQRRTHQVQGKTRPDSTWLGFLMHTPQSAAPPNRTSQSQSWPNLIACFGELSNYEAYAPWRLPLYRDHRGKTAEQRMKLFGLTTTLKGKKHPAENPPQLEPARDAEVFAELPTMATSGPMQQFYDKLDTALIQERNKRRQDLLDKINLEMGEARSAAMAKRDTQLRDLEAENEQFVQDLEETMEKRRLAHRNKVEEMHARHTAELQELVEVRMKLAEGQREAQRDAKEKIRDILYKGVDFAKLSEAFIQQHRSSLTVPSSDSPFSGLSPSRIGRNVASSIANSFPGRLLFPPSKDQQAANQEEELRNQLDKLSDEINLALVREGWAAEILKGLQEKREILEEKLRAMAEEKKRTADLERQRVKEELAAKFRKELEANDMSLDDFFSSGEVNPSKKRSADNLEDLETGVHKKSRTREDELREARAGKKPESRDDEQNSRDDDDMEQDTDINKRDDQQSEQDDQQHKELETSKEDDVPQDKTDDQQKERDDQQTGKADNLNHGKDSEKTTGNNQAEDSVGANSQNSAEDTRPKRRDLREATRYFKNCHKLQPKSFSRDGLRLSNPPSGRYLDSQLEHLERENPRKHYRMTLRSHEKLGRAKERGEDVADIYSEYSFNSGSERSPSPRPKDRRNSTPPTDPQGGSTDVPPATRYYLGHAKRSPNGTRIPLVTPPSGKYLEHQRKLVAVRRKNLRQTTRCFEKARLAKENGVREEDAFSEYSYVSDTDIE